MCGKGLRKCAGLSRGACPLLPSSRSKELGQRGGGRAMRWAGALLQVPLPPGHSGHCLCQLEEGSLFSPKTPGAQNRRNLTAGSEKPAQASPPNLPRLRP